MGETAEDDAGGVADGGPGLTYMPFVVMEDLLDKLKLLNYEEVRDYYVEVAVGGRCYCSFEVVECSVEDFFIIMSDE